MVWFAPILGAVAGGLISSVSNRNQQNANNRQTEQNYQMSRADFLEDRAYEKSEAHKRRLNDIRLAKNLTQDERAFQKRMLRDERRYNAELTADERNYMAGLTADDRRYAEGRQAADQRTLDEMARQSVESRGVDFAKMRQDAVNAGFNPLSVLGTAGMYSTELQRSLAGGVVPGSHAGGTHAAGGIAGGGGGVSVGGGVSTNGVAMGYARDFQPAMSSGAALGEAVQRGVDTYFNTPEATDPLADALRTAIGTDAVVRDAVSQNYAQPFGYDLTKIAPYTPARTVGSPAVNHAGGVPEYGAPSDSMPSGVMEKGGRKYIPVQLPDGQFGELEASIAGRLDIGPFDQISAGDWAEIVGEVGEVETAVVNDKIRKSVLRRNLGGSSIDKPKKKPPMSRSAPASSSHHFNPWMR